MRYAENIAQRWPQYGALRLARFWSLKRATGTITSKCSNSLQAQVAQPWSRPIARIEMGSQHEVRQNQDYEHDGGITMAENSFTVDTLRGSGTPLLARHARLSFVIRRASSNLATELRQDRTKRHFSRAWPRFMRMEIAVVADAAAVEVAKGQGVLPCGYSAKNSVGARISKPDI